MSKKYLTVKEHLQRLQKGTLRFEREKVELILVPNGDFGSIERYEDYRMMISEHGNDFLVVSQGNRSYILGDPLIILYITW